MTIEIYILANDIDVLVVKIILRISCRLVALAIISYFFVREELCSSAQ